MLGDIFPVGFGGQPFANLRQMVLTIGLMDVGSEFGALAGQRTTSSQQVAGRPHL